MLKRTITIFFLLLELFLYASIIYIDFFVAYLSSTPIKYFSIICCFIYSIIIAFIYKCINPILLALFFTVVADYFLLFTNNFYFGILFFVFVQISYFIYLCGLKKIIPKLILVISLCILANLVIFYLVPSCQPLLFIITLYSLLMLLNIIYYSLHIRKAPHIDIIFLLCGIVLLLLCDIHVGLHNASKFFCINSEFLIQYSNTADKLVWIFYLPSQICIALGNLFHCI